MLLNKKLINRSRNYHTHGWKVHDPSSTTLSLNRVTGGRHQFIAGLESNPGHPCCDSVNHCPTVLPKGSWFIEKNGGYIGHKLFVDM